jgi:hypothetical protein
VAPTPGERFGLAWPSRNADSFPRFVAAFAEAFPDSLNLLLLDHRGTPTAQRLTRPENVRLVCLPPSCPELNPSARVWRDLNAALAWLQCPHLEAQQAYGAQLLRADQAATLQALTGDPSLVEAMHALCP